MDADCCEMGGHRCCCEMGGGAWDSCAAWREHCYWNHMSDHKKRFLVVASSDDFMSIPQEVGGHLRNLISESQVILEAANGAEYPVEFRKQCGDVVLGSGWNAFVNAHHIEQNDYILFIYRGNSSFKVRMFNSAGHEKFLTCSQPPSVISDGVPPFAPCDHHVLNEQVVPNPGHVTSADFNYAMLPGCSLSKELDEKVLDKARAMRCEVPLYVAAMSKSNVCLKNCNVYIPLWLVDNFKEEKTKSTNVQLEAPDNKIYSVGASKHGDDLIVIESGWNAFVASLCIQEKDLLIFRRKGKSRLEVLILDPSGHEKTSSCFVMINSSGAQEMSADSVQIIDPPPPAVMDLSSSDDDDDDMMRAGTEESCRVQKRVTRSCAKTHKIASTSSPSTKPGRYGASKPHDRAPVKLKVGSEPLSSNLGGSYILQRGTTLPLQVEKKVEEKVQAIQPNVPIFVKVMNISSVDGSSCLICEMFFCREYARAACLPNNARKLVLQLEGEERLWETRFEVRNVQSVRRRSYKTRVITKGWREFSRGNALEVGDICLFKQGDTGFKMTVYLIRKSQIEL